MQKLLILFTLVLFIALPVYAQDVSSVSDTVTTPDEMPYKNAIQTNPLGLLMGTYGANFEHRFNPKHGALIYGSILNKKESDGYILSLHYRYYNEPYSEAKFLCIKSDVGIGFKGIFVRKMDIDGIMNIEKDDVKIDYGFNYNAISLGAHFGKTYLWDSGVVLSYWIGYGFPFGDFSWSGAEPEEADLAEGIYTFFSGFEIDISLGYSF